MNQAPDRPGHQSNGTEARLARLGSQETAMRAVLVQLLQDIVVAETRLDRGQAELLVTANEQLVVSAMRAQAEAETANGALDEASRRGGLDPLTGLPNRTVLLDRFETAIFNAKRHGNRVALLFLDLDGFKSINDTFGHASGDHALKLVGECLSSLVRESDTVSRHGGDEFLVLLAEVANVEDATLVAEKVNAALQAYGQLDARKLHLSVSIGISIYPDDGQDAKTLIAQADAAMYVAKNREHGGFAFHHARGQAPAASPPALPALPQRSATQFELAIAEQDQRQRNLLDANESLVLAALGAQELLAAAEEVRRRQSELLDLIATELSDPYAPIRLAASTLGMPGAKASLLPRVQAVIEEQAERMAEMVRQVLAGQRPHGPL